MREPGQTIDKGQMQLPGQENGEALCQKTGEMSDPEKGEQPYPEQKRFPEPSSYISHWPLKRDIIFLDHASFGGTPNVVLEAQQDIRREVERDPYNFFERTYNPALRQSKQALAEFLHTNATGLILFPGATLALNVVLQSLPFTPDDEILTTSQIYSSVRLLLNAIVQRSGATLVIADLPYPIAASASAQDSILARATPRTRLALIDHVPSRTALILPIASIVAALAERGIDTLVDGAHAAGMIPVNVDAIGAAYYAGNCHKWMCAARGAGFLHVRADRHDTVRPLVLARSAHWQDPGRRSYLENSFDWLGTSDPSAYLTVPIAVRFLNTAVPGGFEGLVRRNHALAVEARKIVCQVLGVEPPCPEEMLGTLATVPLPDSVGPETQGILPLQRHLWERHQIEVPIYAWPAHPKRVLRFSVQAHNSLEQYQWLALHLKAALDEEKVELKK